jgi:hypothetical protein
MQTDVIEHYIVEGPSLAVEDLYDGMILMSMSGYPLVIQLDPLFVNNVGISESEQNYFYKNGVAHYLLQYPIPVVPYLGKSSFDVLVRTNEMRGGDLSDFIALIESSADFKFQLQLREGDNKAITLRFWELRPSSLVGDPHRYQGERYRTAARDARGTSAQCNYPRRRHDQWRCEDYRRGHIFGTRRYSRHRQAPVRASLVQVEYKCKIIQSGWNMSMSKDDQ